ncbi:hypothetical protein RRG08_002458 [Elysia crispata]|uniref:Uncharacterized protein n=1 Tax=Elysia crispata TaxID=231223 RepID=A0AAE1A7N7_9GAST|nr:hypothetical protein RRG08_002458 [Elysia crispata]
MTSTRKDMTSRSCRHSPILFLIKGSLVYQSPPNHRQQSGSPGAAVLSCHSSGFNPLSPSRPLGGSYLDHQLGQCRYPLLRISLHL